MAPGRLNAWASLSVIGDPDKDDAILDKNGVVDQPVREGKEK